MPDPEPHEPDDLPSSGVTQRRLPWTWVGIRLIRWCADIAVLGLLLWLVASQGLGMSTVIPWALGRFTPDGWTVRAAEIDGDWRSGIRLEEVLLRGPDTQVRANELRVGFALWPLIHRDIRLSRVDVVAPEVDLTTSEGADALSEQSPAAEAGTPADGSGGDQDGLEALAHGPFPGGWTLEVDTMEVSGGKVRARSPTGSYGLTRLSLAGRVAWADSGLEAGLDSLSLRLRIQPSGVRSSGAQGDSRPLAGRLLVTGGISDGVVKLERLAFDSNHGRVTGAGRMPLSPPSGTEEADLELHAHELDLRYLPFALPNALLRRPEVDVDLTAHETDDSRVSASLTARARAIERERAARVLRVHADAVLRGWSVNGLVGADASVVLIPIPPAPAASGAASLLEDPLRVDVALEGGPATGSQGLAGMTAHASLDRGSRYARGDSLRWHGVGRVRAELGTDTARWALNLQLDSISAVGEGSLDWSSKSPAVVVERLRTEGLDLRALSRDWPHTSITGRLTGRSSGASVDSLRGEWRVALAPSSMAGAAIDALDLNVRQSPGSIRGRASVTRESSRLSLVYAATLEDTTVRANFTDLTLAPSSDAPGDSSVQAHGTATARWTLGASRRGSATLTLDSARIGGLRFRSANLEASLAGEALTGSARAQVIDALPAPVSLRASLETDGFDPATMEGTLSLDARPIRGVQDRLLDSLHAEVTARGNGRLALDGVILPSAGGRVRVEGRAVADDPEWSLEASVNGRVGEVDDDDATDGLVRADSVSLVASARRTPHGWRSVAFSLESTGLRWEDVRADTVLADLELDSSEVALDTLRVVSNVAELSGRGRLSRDTDSSEEIRISGDVLDPAPLLAPDDTGSVTFGRSRVQATLSGSPDSVALRSSLSVGAFIYGALRASGSDVALSASVIEPLRPERRIRHASLELGMDRLVLPDTEVRRVDIAAEGGPDSLRVEASALVDDLRRGTLHARIDRRPEGHRATIERLDLQLDEDQWSLADSAWVDYGAAGGYALRSLALEAGEQSVFVDGEVGADRSLDVQVEADSLDIATIADLVGLPGVQGWLGGRAQLSGTLDRPVGWTYLRGGLHRADAQPAPARIHLTSDGARISGDVDLHSEAEGHLRVDGSIRIPGMPADADSSGMAPLEIRLISDDFRLSALRPVIDRETVGDLDGVLHADVSIRGTPSEPDLDGPLRVLRGRMSLPALGARWEDVGLAVHASGTDLVLDSARATSGPGSATLAGTMSLTESYPIDLSARLSSFQAIRTDAYHATVSGQLTASGTVGRPEVEGDVSVESLDVYLGRRVADRNLEEVELTAEDLRMLRERFGYVPAKAGDRPRPLADRLSADLVVHLGRDSWLRNRSSPELSVPFTGDVETHLRPGEEPDLQGQVTTIAGRGFVEQFGRRFELEEGTVTFDGPPEEARLDLSATYTIPSHDDPNDAEATIILTVQGTQERLDLDLSSDPPMENSDIVSYIATGRPAAGALSFQGSQSQGGLAEAGADLALGQLTGVIESAAGQRVGLDVVEIRREGLRQATLVAGKYISPRVYVGFAQPVTLQEGDGLSLGNEGESEVEVEIEALRWLLLNVEGSSSALRLFLKGRYAY